MKNAILICFMIFLNLAVIAQTVIQPSGSPADQPATVSTWDTLAIIIGSITLSAFLVYLVWSYSQKKITPRVKK